MSNYFTEAKVLKLIAESNWELVEFEGYKGGYRLRQKDKHYMVTRPFNLSADFAEKHL